MKKISKRESGGGGGDSWLNTYADMVTLLLTFFVLLFTMSSVDAEKWQILVKAFGEDIGDTSQVVLVPTQGDGLITSSGDTLPDLSEIPDIIEPIDFNQLYAYIKKYVDENELGATVSLQKGPNSVFITFEDNIFFDPDKSNLKEQSKPLLDFLGDGFLAVQDEILSIRINGHTATVPGTVKKPGFDRSLSSERANSVLLYFEEVKKFDPKKLISIGYGRNYPVAENDTEEGRKKNRRVEIMILSNDFDLSEESDLFRYMNGQSDVSLIDDNQNREEILIPQTSAAPSQGPATSPQPAQSTPDPTPSGKEVYENVSPYDD